MTDDMTAAEHIASAQQLVEVGNYDGAHAHAAIAQAILAQTDALAWKLVDAWREASNGYHKSGNLEYSLALHDCHTDLREVLRHNRKPNR